MGCIRPTFRFCLHRLAEFALSGHALVLTMRRLLVLTTFLVLFSVPLHSQGIKELTNALQGPSKAGSREQPGYFRYAFADLNGDKIDDAIVLMRNPQSCGSGGCDMEIFRGTKTGFEFVSHSTITNAPIRVSSEKVSGWNSIIVGARGVGEVAMRFDGKKYPLNPSMQPKATAAQLSGARTILKSIVLEDEWTYKEEVGFEKIQDGGHVHLQDGREISVFFDNKALTD